MTEIFSTITIGQLVPTNIGWMHPDETIYNLTGVGQYSGCKWIEGEIFRMFNIQSSDKPAPVWTPILKSNLLINFLKKFLAKLKTIAQNFNLMKNIKRRGWQ